jgi:hypothetical protein
VIRKLRTDLEKPYKRINGVCFMNAGIASVVASGTLDIDGAR